MTGWTLTPAAEQFGEAAQRDGSEAFYPGDAANVAEGGLVEVDVQHDLGCERGEVDVAEGVEEVGGESEGTRRRRRFDVRLVEVEVEVQLGVGLGGGVLQEKGQELGGAGEPPEREGAELVGAGVGVAGRDDLADPVHDGVHGDRVACLESGDEGAQSVLIRPSEPDVAAKALRLAPLVVQLGVGLDHLGLGDREDASGGLGGDHARHGGVHDIDLVDRQVAGELGDAPGHPCLALAAPRHRPGQRQPMLQVEDVGERVTRSHHSGAAGQGYLAQAEVLHLRRAVAADLDQDVAEASGRGPVGTLGRVAGVDGRPLGEHLEVVDLCESTRLHGLGRPGQEAGCVEV